MCIIDSFVHAVKLLCASGACGVNSCVLARPWTKQGSAQLKWRAVSVRMKQCSQNQHVIMHMSEWYRVAGGV